MSFWKSRTTEISVLALTAIMAAGAPAQAQNLFGRLFGAPAGQGDFPAAPPPPTTGSIERTTPAPRTAQRSAPAPKVKAPSYFDYKVDSLPVVDFKSVRTSAIVPEPEEMMLPAERRPLFADAAASLDALELRAERDVAEVLVKHYAAAPAFIWLTEDGTVNEQGRAVLRVLGEAASHGLEAADYAVTVPVRQPGAGAVSPGDLAAFEMTLSARVLRYARDARRGRIDPNRISGYHDFELKSIDLAEVIGTLASGKDPRALLESFHPQGREYKALRVELEALSALEENDIVVDPKLLVRPGGSNAELPKIVQLIERKSDEEFRQEHGVLLAELRNSEVYSDAMVPLIKAAQESRGLKPDGVIGPRTVEALAGTSRAERMAKVKIALEQRRWLPEKLAPRRVFINQPAFTASYYENDAEKLSMRVVIGTVANQTTFFQDEIEYVEYNPYWGVPQSIIVNEMLPRLRRDPGYLDRAGYEVTNAKGKRIPSSSVDWGAYGGRVPYSIRQTPSEANALGELKIMFPNKHAIYMHDTPAKKYFDRDVRAFSHGCVRLHDPRGMAAAVLGKTREHVAARIGKGHNSERLSEKVPVYVSYFTAWPDEAGKVAYFADVYGRDDRMKAAMEKTSKVRAGI